MMMKMMMLEAIKMMNKAIKLTLTLSLLGLGSATASASNRLYNETSAGHIERYYAQARVTGVSGSRRVRLTGARLRYLPYWGARVRFRNGYTAPVRNVYRRVGKRLIPVNGQLTVTRPRWARGPITRLSFDIRVWVRLRTPAGASYLGLRTRRISIQIGRALTSYRPLLLSSSPIGLDRAQLRWVYNGPQADRFEIFFARKTTPWEVATNLQRLDEVSGSARSVEVSNLEDGLWYHFVVRPIVYGQLRITAENFTVVAGGPSTGWIVDQSRAPWTGATTITHLPGFQSFEIRLQMTTSLPEVTGGSSGLIGGRGPAAGRGPEGSFTFTVIRADGSREEVSGTWSESIYQRAAGQRTIVFTHDGGAFRLTMNTAVGGTLSGSLDVDGREYLYQLTR